jgi:outer membrane protein insertion porin family
MPHYCALSQNLTLSLSGEAAYGDGYGDIDDGLPFFEHYFAGGVLSGVRGFQDNTLGPRDSRGNPFGGSSKLIGSAEVFFPVPFIEDSKSLRLGAFIDAGNVFANDDAFKVGELRYSTGLSGKWLSPFGAIKVSVAQPVNARGDDQTQVFQFQFGSGF